MKRVMVLLAFFWVSTLATKAYSQSLSTTENIFSNKVEYVIENTDTVTLSFSYIVIQDNILMRAQGDKTLSPAESFTISIDCENAPNHTFELTLSNIEEEDE